MLIKIVNKVTIKYIMLIHRGNMYSLRLCHTISKKM